MEKTFSKIKTLKSRRKLSLPAAASPLMNNAGHHGETNHDTVMHFIHFFPASLIFTCDSCLSKTTGLALSNSF